MPLQIYNIRLLSTPQIFIVPSPQIFMPPPAYVTVGRPILACLIQDTYILLFTRKFWQYSYIMNKILNTRINNSAMNITVLKINRKAIPIDDH